MHIVFFTMCLNRGGTERVITNLCNECLVKNHRVSIVTCLMEQRSEERRVGKEC